MVGVEPPSPLSLLSNVVDDFKQVIEQVKLRNPIEDVVRERVSGLRRAGSLWVACCPFHEEKTPSFKVDPRRGTWRCYGACGVGGDQIKFVERVNNVEFMEALEILAARVGYQLPERRGERPREESDELYAVLARAEKFYRGWLRRPEGAAALDYVRARGLTDATIDAFGVGFAPIGGRELVARAISQGVAQERLIELGLARADATGGGRARDYFQGRLIIPVRDLRGRTVGFGARRLSDEDKRSPKYINTPQTPLFHKGRLIYALDAALEHIRTGGHMILVEGYTDVMAAHQVGCRNFVGVLGTATTDDHAALVRRSGARRVSLLFDGDEAGQRATWRALEGLLSLDIVIDVVRLVGDKDPCELLVREGVAPLEQYLAQATGWFEFLVEGVRARAGEERWREIDRVLALFLRIPRPLVRDERIAQLAAALEIPADALRAQLASLPERRRAQEARSHSGEDAAAAATAGAASSVTHPRELLAYRELTAALLLEPTLARLSSELLAELVAPCSDARLKRILECVCELTRDAGSFAADAVTTTSATADADAVQAQAADYGFVDRVLTALALDPARELVVPLLEYAAGSESLRELFDDNVRVLRAELEQRRIEELRRARTEALEPTQRLAELHRLFQVTRQ